MTDILGSWFLRDTFEPESGMSQAWFETGDGTMPVGTNVWQVALNQQWVDENITLSLLFDEIDVAEVRF